jgi:hypothetical protein
VSDPLQADRDAVVRAADEVDRLYDEARTLADDVLMEDRNARIDEIIVRWRAARDALADHVSLIESMSETNRRTEVLEKLVSTFVGWGLPELAEQVRAIITEMSGRATFRPEDLAPAVEALVHRRIEEASNGR